jgi:hypothetical protein
MFIYCVCNKKEKKRKKNVNQIFSHMNPTLLPIGPYALKTLKIFLKLQKLKLYIYRRVEFKNSICLKLVLEILEPRPSSKVTCSFMISWFTIGRTHECKTFTNCKIGFSYLFQAPSLEKVSHPKGFTPTPFSTLYVLLYNLLILWKVKCGD